MVSLTRRKWTWIGHVIRKEPRDIPKEGLFWTPEEKDNGKGLDNLEEVNGKRTQIHTLDLE